MFFWNLKSKYFGLIATSSERKRTHLVQSKFLLISYGVHKHRDRSRTLTLLVIQIKCPYQ
jgi:hypothetical protein